MKKTPPWLIWTLATFALWVIWGLAVFAQLQSKEARLSEELSSLKNRKTEVLNLLAAAPVLIEQMDSIRSRFYQVTEKFTTADDLPRLLSELKSGGYRQGINLIEVTLDLTSTLGISTGTGPSTGEFSTLDTLFVELKAHGPFRAIGTWLDEIEMRADFQQWNSCRWDQGKEQGQVGFFGTAAFWVVATGTSP